jgi:hypothetical protein
MKKMVLHGLLHQIMRKKTQQRRKLTKVHLRSLAVSVLGVGICHTFSLAHLSESFKPRPQCLFG